jgi:pimeloyl-ACP methyl ester carboxylesterase
VAGVDVTAQLSSIDVPGLALVARHDRLVPREASAELARGCPRLVEQVIDGPHALLQTRPQEAAQAIVDFMSCLRPRERGGAR